MQKKILILIAILFSLSFRIEAQIGGRNVYRILDLNYSSRNASLGGGLISVFDSDASMIISNPSFISKEHHNSLSFNFVDYFGNTAYASALYSRTFQKAGSFALDMRYIGYGKMTRTDEYGEEFGEFTAGDYCLTLGWGRWLNDRFSIGANFKSILSSYESYTSFGLAVDVAGSYYNSDKRLSMSILFKNIGSELKPFTSGNFERIPFDIQFAFSQRLAHLPVRYHFSLHSLYRWNMSYVGANNPIYPEDAINGIKYPSKTAQFFDNFFRHLIFGLEIEPSKYFSLMISYNHNRHQEMMIPQKGSMAGFSYGFFVNIHSIRIGFSRSHYAVGAVPNYITFSCNMDELSNLSKENKQKKLEKVKKL